MLYYFKYYLNDSSSFIVVSTTRPETVFGDVAVAINPKDKKNIGLLGKKVKSPFNGNLLDIISDEYVDLDKGSGALKVTPGHDFNDYEVGQRNNLEIMMVLSQKALILYLKI